MSASMFLVQPDLSVPPADLPPHPYTFPLDPFQQHAICAIAKEEHVLVCAKTGSGKTLVGEYQIYHSLSKGMRVFYTTPIKSLSNQKFQDLKEQFHDASVGIMTGDIKFCPDAQIVIMTTEILRNLLYKKGAATEHLGLTASLSMENVDAIVFDECHYINDQNRGAVWEETMILLPSSIKMVMLSATLDRPEQLARWLGEQKRTPVHLIQTHYRIVPLTHYLLDKDKMVTLMDAKETYHEPVYLQWRRGRHQQEDEQRAYQRAVADAKRQGQTGVVPGKTHVAHFVHQMNDTIALLQKEELLPAIWFVLSRKQCEAYASQVEHTLLDSSDTAAVKHILSFHLHRYHLETVPQYHQIRDLLCRGIAFHHSGLLPLLKEIVEILFSKGFVKLLFCTETFAVGLNMPTKTVIFAGFKKYDEERGAMRVLRTDEYFQMAGRAGRRGKDTKGVVLYVPDREPLDPREMFQMMKGTLPPLSSHMTFHYDFLLKAIPSSTTWLHIMEQSYWFQERQREREALQKARDACASYLETLTLEEPYRSGCEARYQIEQERKKAVNAPRKELQRQMDSLLNKQVGPRWKTAWGTFHTRLEQSDMLAHHEALLEEKVPSYVEPMVSFLYRTGYLTQEDPYTLQKEHVTLKGVLATEINEGHSLLITELYTQGVLSKLSGEELVLLLSVFQDSPRQEEHTAEETHAVLREYPLLQEALGALDRITEDLQKVEEEVGSSVGEYWETTTQWMAPMARWIRGEHASVICAESNLFEGNFLRAIMKLVHTLDEVQTIAVYCQHTEYVDLITAIRPSVLRDVALSESLYVK